MELPVSEAFLSKFNTTERLIDFDKRMHKQILEGLNLEKMSQNARDLKEIIDDKEKAVRDKISKACNDNLTYFGAGVAIFFLIFVYTNYPQQRGTQRRRKWRKSKKSRRKRRAINLA